MTTKRLWLFGVLIYMLCAYAPSNLFSQCNDFIREFPTGELIYIAEFENQQAYVEVFITNNGVQQYAVPIVDSEAQDTLNNTYYYRFVLDAGTFADGSVTTCRFYAYADGQPGVFIPGPSEGVWSEPYVVGEGCETPDPVYTCQSLTEIYGDNKITITSLSDGDVEYAITYPEEQSYVEVFGKQNMLQNVAANITGTGVENIDGTYTYTLVRGADQFAEGDEIVVRFYSYINGVPGQNFVPGPDASQWTNESFVYTVCPDVVFVTTWGNDANQGTVSSPFLTVEAALSFARIDSTIDQIQIAAGTYIEQNLEVINGVDILGGYSQDFLERDITNTLPEFETVIDADSDLYWGYSGGDRVFIAFEINEPTLIEGLHLTGGAVAPYGYHGGGNLLIMRCNDNFVVQNNLIDYGRIISYGTYNYGGNVYVSQSTCKILNNQIIHGYSYAGAGDLLVEEIPGSSEGPEVAYNVFTNPYTVMVYSGDYHDNTYLNATRKGVRKEIESKVIDQTLVINYEAPQTIVVDIYNITGSYIRTTKGTDKVSLLNLTSGIYLAKIQTPSGYTSKKIYIP